jgi:hypothetical protein
MKFNKKPIVLKETDSSINKEELAKKFILGASISERDPSTQIEQPKRKKWEEISIEKETVIFNFRIPKKDMQQLKYISNEKKISLNALCLMAIQEQNKKILKDLEEFS